MFFLNDNFVCKIVKKYKIKEKILKYIQDIKDEQRAMSIFTDAYPKAEFRTLHSNMSKQDIKDNRKWFENTDEGLFHKWTSCVNNCMTFFY